jgi:hypothetical protein
LEDAQPRGGKEPNIPVLAVSAPARLVCVPYRSLSIFFNKLLRYSSKETTQSMKYLHKTSSIYSGMLTDSTHGKTVEIVHRDGVGNELISVKTLGKYSGRLRCKRAFTTATISFR